MNKLQMDPPLGGGTVPGFVVRAQRVARPQTPWAWAIYEEGKTYPFRCSTRLYRSAEDAWAVGRTLLCRLPKSAINALAATQPCTDPGDDPASD
jgi:hypothetical protein